MQKSYFEKEEKTSESEQSPSTASNSCLEKKDVICSDLNPTQCSQMEEYCRISEGDSSKCEELPCSEFNKTQCDEHEKCAFYDSISQCFSSKDRENYCLENLTSSDSCNSVQENLCFWSEEFSKCHSTELEDAVTCSNPEENKGCLQCFGFSPEKCQICKKGLNLNADQGFTCTCKADSNNCKVCDETDSTNQNCKECDADYELIEEDGIKICQVKEDKICLAGDEKIEYCLSCDSTNGKICTKCNTTLATLNKDMNKCIKKDE